MNILIQEDKLMKQIILFVYQFTIQIVVYYQKMIVRTIIIRRNLQLVNIISYLILNESKNIDNSFN